MDTRPIVFLSWSGDKSHAVAKVFYKRIGRLIQACEPWISSNDLTVGRAWREELDEKLGDERTAVGLFVLTKKNQNEPWLLFEYGRLSDPKKDRLCPPICCDFRPAQIKGPLAAPNGVTTSKDDIQKMVQDIRRHIDPTLSDEVLNGTFEEMWPIIQDELSAALGTPEDEGDENAMRGPDEMIAEVLELTRINAEKINQLLSAKPNAPHEILGNRISPEIGLQAALDGLPQVVRDRLILDAMKVGLRAIDIVRSNENVCHVVWRDAQWNRRFTRCEVPGKDRNESDISDSSESSSE